MLCLMDGEAALNKAVNQACELDAPKMAAGAPANGRSD
jgi:hypothetical protein